MRERKWEVKEIDLRLYLRAQLSRKVVPIFKEEKCNECDSTENLELHHEIHFIQLLNQTLNELFLIFKDTSEYTKSELKLIKYVFLGKHLDIKYKTLCSACHKQIHDKYGKIFTYGNERREADKRESLESGKKDIDIYFNDRIGKKLFKYEKELLKEFLLNLKEPPKTNHGSIGIKVINDYIKNIKLDYIITSKVECCGENRNQRYWIISHT